MAHITRPSRKQKTATAVATPPAPTRPDPGVTEKKPPKAARGRPATTRARMAVSVTAEDIGAAVPKDSAHCMIADAIKRQLPHTRNVSVDLATIRWTDPSTGMRITYLTPGVAQERLLQFDEGVELEPFTFRLPTAPAFITPTKSRRGKRPSGNDDFKASHNAGGTGTRIGAPPRQGALSSKRSTGKIRAFGLRSMGRPSR